MPERERHHQRSDVYADYRSRGYSHSEGDCLHESQSCNQKPRRVEMSSADERRATENRLREMTKKSQREPHTSRGHSHEGASKQRIRRKSENHSEKEYCEQQHRQTLYNLRYTLTARGLCQLCELFVNLLIIICAGVPYSNNGGYRDLASYGGLYHYYFGGAGAFTGADADRVKELDRLFHQLKRPPYIFTMVFGGILMIYSCTMFALGIFRVPYRWPPLLLLEALLNLLISLAYIVALAFYFIKVQETYSDPICKEREQMYKNKGHRGFECQFNGADISGGLFGVVGVFVFIFGVILTVRAFRSVRELKQQNANEDIHF